LFHQRSAKPSTDWSGFGFALLAIFMPLLSIGAAFAVSMAVDSAQCFEAERGGKIVVSSNFVSIVRGRSASELTAAERDLDTFYSSQADRIVERYGGKRAAIEQKLRDEARAHGGQNFISFAEASGGIKSIASSGPLPAMLGSLVLFWWAVMLVFQGEGLELDLQRRRHPMWEWLFSHPAPPGAIFLAEMLSPIAANPIFWGGPLFVGFMYGFVYGPEVGVLAGVLVGVPIALAAACLAKALEIGVVLR
jgi:hypothetical protein